MNVDVGRTSLGEESGDVSPNHGVSDLSSLQMLAIFARCTKSQKLIEIALQIPGFRGRSDGTRRMELRDAFPCDGLVGNAA